MQAASTRFRGPVLASWSSRLLPTVSHCQAPRLPRCIASHRELPCYMGPRGRAALAALGSRAPHSVVFSRTSLHVTASTSSAVVQGSPLSVPDTSDPTAPFPAEALPTLSGYLPVSSSASCESKLFHCYYEAQCSERPLTETPVLLWLNGGPGCSSMIGNFYELGPYIVQGVDGRIKRNDWAWNKRYGVLYVDNPIGTGFSVAAKPEDIPLNQSTVAEHLYHALTTLFRNPSLAGRPLFLTGESYAGKYVPALACKILDSVKEAVGKASVPFDFQGVAIGNGFTDPRTQVQVHAEVMTSFGLLDEQQAAYVDRVAQEVVELVDREMWVEAHHKRTDLCTWIEHTSGIPTLLDIRRHAKYHATEDKVEYLALFLNRPQVKAALNADADIEWMSCRPHLRLHMAVDTMKSYKYMVERLLEEDVPTLLFQGMYDAKDGPLSSERWMKTMHAWKDLTAFLLAPREVWRTKRRDQGTGEGRLAGYTRRWGPLTHIVLIGAGHQVPADQPENALEMIETWVETQMARRAQRQAAAATARL